MLFKQNNHSIVTRV